MLATKELAVMEAVPFKPRATVGCVEIAVKVGAMASAILTVTVPVVVLLLASRAVTVTTALVPFAQEIVVGLYVITS